MKEQSKDDGIWPIPCFFIRLGARRTGVTEAARPTVGRMVIRRNLRTGERQLSHCLPAGSSNNRSHLPEQGYCARPSVGGSHYEAHAAALGRGSKCRNLLGTKSGRSPLYRLAHRRAASSR
ncbi:MAG TPA: hypothetical protein VMF65_25680, partial [Acidimicrobiales bacterium]|nr:hypothetical protein [Acidimicrobiales bacterium]